jgi:hypothetical protein
MQSATLVLAGLALGACGATYGEKYTRETGEACTGGNRVACETLITLHPQALRDADAIMAGMQQARSERRAVQRATQ